MSLLSVGLLTSCGSKDDVDEMTEVETESNPSELLEGILVNGAWVDRIESFPLDKLELEAIIPPTLGARIDWNATQPGVAVLHRGKFADLVPGGTEGVFDIICKVLSSDENGEKEQERKLQIDVRNSWNLPVIDTVLLDDSFKENGGSTTINAGRAIDIYINPLEGTTVVNTELVVSGGIISQITPTHFVWLLPETPVATINMLVRGKSASGRGAQLFGHTFYQQ